MPSRGTRYQGGVCQIGDEPVPTAIIRTRVAELMDTEFCAKHIARKIGAKWQMVEKIIKQIDNETSEEIRNAPLEARGMYRRAYMYAFNELLAKSKEIRLLRGEDGNVIFDENGQKIHIQRGFTDKERLQWIKTINQLSELDENVKAASKSVSLNIDHKAHSLVNPEIAELIRSNPKALKALLDLEEFVSEQQRQEALNSGHLAIEVKSLPEGGEG